MSTRTYGRLHYKAAAAQVRHLRRHTDDNVGDAMAAAFAALFTFDAHQAGEPEHFDQAKFTARAMILPKAETATAAPAVDLSEFEAEFTDE